MHERLLQFLVELDIELLKRLPLSNTVLLISVLSLILRKLSVGVTSLLQISLPRFLALLEGKMNKSWMMNGSY